MSQVEYLQSVYHQNRGTEERRNAQRLFFRRHGMDENLTDKLLGRGQDYLKRVSVLPPSYRRISHGDEISIGTRRFKVITGGGHALDQVMLYCAADKLFLSADQVLSKISPNVSVWAVEPDQNSLGEYLASLASLTTTLPYDVMVLPGHGVPFYGLKTRIKQLADHHEDRCRLIAEACRDVPQTSKELVPVVFHKHVLDVHQMGFAAGELIAHVNYMLVEGRLTSEVDRRRAAVPDHLIDNPSIGEGAARDSKLIHGYWAGMGARSRHASPDARRRCCLRTDCPIFRRCWSSRIATPAGSGASSSATRRANRSR